MPLRWSTLFVVCSKFSWIGNFRSGDPISVNSSKLQSTWRLGEPEIVSCDICFGCKMLAGNGPSTLSCVLFKWTFPDSREIPGQPRCRRSWGLGTQNPLDPVLIEIPSMNQDHFWHRKKKFVNFPFVWPAYKSYLTFVYSAAKNIFEDWYPQLPMWQETKKFAREGLGSLAVPPPWNLFRWWINRWWITMRCRQPKW